MARGYGGGPTSDHRSHPLGLLPAAELLALVRHPLPLVRANAIERLPECGELPLPEAVDALAGAVAEARNEFRLMGTITVAHLAIKALLRIDGAGTQRAWELIGSWPEANRGDLLWFLRSERVIA